MGTSIGNYNVPQQLTSCKAAATGNVSGVYSNGPSNDGVNATLTLSAATLTVDGIQINLFDRVLLPNQTQADQNGIYFYAALVNGNIILQRVNDFQSSGQMRIGMYFTIEQGTSFGSDIFVLATPQPIIVGTTSITFNNIASGSGLTFPLNPSLGGTGVANASAHTITLANTLTTVGNNPLTLTTTGTTNATFPSGTVTLLKVGSGITQVVTQVFTSSGTYTPTAGMVYCIIECIGSGGGGGGIANGGAGTAGSAGGGGSGGYSRKYSTAAAIGASQTVTVGAGGLAGTNADGNGGNGGDVSVGVICVGKGGTGGTGGAAGAGGAGGIAGTGDVSAVGNAGGNGDTQSIITANVIAGMGAPSILGGAPGLAILGASTAGATANVYGAGANGATTWNAGGAAAGGVGGKGIAIITEFLAV